MIFSMWVTKYDFVDTENQKLSRRVPQTERQQKKYSIQSDIKTLLGKDYEVEKINKFLKKIEI